LRVAVGGGSGGVVVISVEALLNDFKLFSLVHIFKIVLGVDA